MRDGKDVDFTYKPAKYQFHVAHTVSSMMLISGLNTLKR